MATLRLIARHPSPQAAPPATTPEVAVAPAITREQGTELLVYQLQSGSREAKAVLFDRYAQHVGGMLGRLLGNDPELSDVLHDVFVAAYAGITRLKEPRALTNWLTQITVFTARKHIRTRKRRRLLLLVGFDAFPDSSTELVPLEVGDALRATYAVLSKLDTDERIAFALRHIEGMDLLAVAAAMNVSLATVKRRLTRAQQNFKRLAQKYPVLHSFLEDAE
jgi:RNA polymerase sigma-70 factor (ECF subfamily)